MSEMVTEFRERTSLARSLKAELKDKFARLGALVAIGGTSIVGVASAAINFTPITELIEAVASLIPSLMDLVIELAPFMVLMAIITFLVTFFKDTLLGMIRM